MNEERFDVKPEHGCIIIKVVGAAALCNALWSLGLIYEGYQNAEWDHVIIGVTNITVTCSAVYVLYRWSKNA